MSSTQIRPSLIRTVNVDEPLHQKIFKIGIDYFANYLLFVSILLLLRGNPIAYTLITFEQLFDTHEPIGVLIYDEKYRLEVESYNGPFFPEPPGWSAKAIHLLTNHVKRFTSCSTCKTSEHTTSICPIRARFFIPDVGRRFPSGRPYFKPSPNRLFPISTSPLSKGGCAPISTDEKAVLRAVHANSLTPVTNVATLTTSCKASTLKKSRSRSTPPPFQ